jgi:DNA-binding NarL/FixJ family response regulator
MIKSSKKAPYPRILLADDNKDMRNAIIRQIEGEYSVVQAVGNGRALVDAAAELLPDIGVVDISMPLMNGLEAVSEIKNRGLGMKIVFLTVNEDPDFVRAAFDTGATGYVVKRQMASDLLTALDAVMNGGRFLSSCCKFEGESDV